MVDERWVRGDRAAEGKFLVYIIFFFFLYFFRLLFGRKGKNAYLCTVRDK